MFPPRSFRAAWPVVPVVALVLLGAAPLPLQASDNAKAGMSDGMQFSEQDGEALYRAICQGCHMPDGQGARGAGGYPALASNPRLAASAYPVLNVLNGLKGMPSFKPNFRDGVSTNAYLSDAQIAAVVNYVRTHMGNHYEDTVTAASVAALHR